MRSGRQTPLSGEEAPGTAYLPQQLAQRLAVNGWNDSCPSVQSPFYAESQIIPQGTLETLKVINPCCEGRGLSEEETRGHSPAGG